VLTLSHSRCLNSPPLELPTRELPWAVVHRKHSTKVGQTVLDILDNINLVIHTLDVHANATHGVIEQGNVVTMALLMVNVSCLASHLD
jgi:hypothetical protein